MFGVVVVGEMWQYFGLVVFQQFELLPNKKKEMIDHVGVLRGGRGAREGGGGQMSSEMCVKLTLRSRQSSCTLPQSWICAPREGCLPR
jgi:hypothetical protein